MVVAARGTGMACAPPAFRVVWVWAVLRGRGMAWLEGKLESKTLLPLLPGFLWLFMLLLPGSQSCVLLSLSVMRHHCSQGKEPELWVLMPLLPFFSYPGATVGELHCGLVSIAATVLLGLQAQLPASKEPG